MGRRREENIMESAEMLKNVVDLSMVSVEISVSTAHILSGTRDVQNASTSMASAVEELAASIGELQNAAERSSQATHESNQLTQEGMHKLGDLKNDIMETGTVFDTVSDKTKDLQDVVGSLSKVIDLISKIAGQTNLLALNATIEAARAGEHGKGFAVVANEVKSLSRQTSEATETIRNQINQLNVSFSEVLESMGTTQSTIKRVIDKAEMVAEDFNRISDNQNAISQQVSELAGIMSQQRTASQQLSENMTVVKSKSDDNLNSVNRLADQTDNSINLIEEWRAKLADEDIENKVIYLAQADHLLWKKRLLDMAVGRVKAGASSLTGHSVCRLGKWYYDKAATEKFSSLPAFKAMETPHKAVHDQGIEAAKCFERHDLDTGMQHYRMLDAASKEVVSNLQKLLRA